MKLYVIVLVLVLPAIYVSADDCAATDDYSDDSVGKRAADAIQEAVMQVYNCMMAMEKQYSNWLHLKQLAIDHGMPIEKHNIQNPQDNQMSVRAYTVLSPAASDASKHSYKLLDQCSKVLEHASNVEDSVNVIAVDPPEDY